jgi:hypothetical protein
MTTKLQDALSDEVGRLRPTRRWQAAGSADDVELWQRDENVWEHLDPPEDLALPPLLPWSPALEALTLAVYRVDNYDLLEDRQYYDISWPPQGNLWTAGSWRWSEFQTCPVHGDRYDSDCEECPPPDQTLDVIVDEPAQWHWQVRVEICERRIREGRIVETDVIDDHYEDWIIGSTLVDPREVQYGPSRHHPLRTLLITEQPFGSG